MGMGSGTGCRIAGAGIVGGVLSVLCISISICLSGACRCPATGNRGVCAAGFAEVGGIGLLVLLPKPGGVLSLRQTMSERLDEGCSVSAGKVRMMTL